MIQYEVYKLSLSEYIMTLCLACSGCLMIGFIFFNNWVLAAIFSLVGVVLPRIRRDHLQQKRVQELNLQFKQALYILSSSLAAGQSVETAFREASIDLQHLYPDENTDIRQEFKIISKRLDNGESIETILHHFSERARVEDIHNFSEVFITCKRSGGNLVEVMRNTANIIGDKISIQQDIAVMIAQKRLESKILTISPVLFIAILRWTSAEYMAPLYMGKGRLIMIGALILLIICYFVCKKLMEIRI